MRILLLTKRREYKSWEIRITEELEKRGYEVFCVDRYKLENLPQKRLDAILQLMQHNLEHTIKLKEKYNAPFFCYFTGTAPSFREELKEAVSQVDVPIAWSYTAKKQLEEYYKVEFKVNYLGVDLEQPGIWMQPAEERRGYYTISGDWRHKRIDILVRNIPRQELTLIGNHGLKKKYGELATGYVSDVEKNRIRSRKKTFIHSSLAEGFNLPACSALWFNNYLIMYDLHLYHELYGELIGKSVFLWEDEEQFKELIDKVRDLPNFDYGRKYILDKGLMLQNHVERLEEMLEEVVS